jgi:hypothetical protein
MRDLSLSLNYLRLCTSTYDGREHEEQSIVVTNGLKRNIKVPQHGQFVGLGDRYASFEHCAQ